MGKKRPQGKQKKRWTRKRPDEVLNYGPLRIERYGKYIHLRKDSTPEEHAAFLERAKKVNEEVLAELESELAILQSLVTKYDPVQLMHRAAYMLLPLFMKYRSENEFQADESYFLPTVEYLQYLIARTESNIAGTEPDEKEWEEIWQQALKVMHLTQSHLMFRGTLTTPPTEIDELRFILDGRRLLVRVRRYPLFFADNLRSALSPYELEVKEIYGTGVEEIINELAKVDEYLRAGVIGRYVEMHKLTGTLMEKLREKGFSADPGASQEEVERTRAALETEEFKFLQEEMEEKLRLTFTAAIFEITDLTGLPKSFLSFLSVKPGESVLKTMTGTDHDDLSPLSTSLLHYKPFLEASGKFYSFYHSGFEDHIADIIEAGLFQKRPGRISEMAKRRSNRLESDSKELLASIIQFDFAFQNVYYPNPDDTGSLTELDLLFGVDDILFIVEAKAGGLSQPARRGAPKSLAQEFSDLIIEGQRQSERAERYVKSADEVVFFDETGRREICRIRQSQYRKIFRIVVTREDLGWVGAKIAILSILDKSLSKAYPWHVSIDDLRIVAELFRDDEIRFVHYLEVRLQASSEATLSQHDEIEHIGLYNKMNYYFKSPVKGVDMISYDASYMREIDYHFMDRTAGGTSNVPTQEMPPNMRQFISALRVSRLRHRFEVGSVILSMDSTGRAELKEALDVLDKGRAEGRQRTVRMPFSARKFGLTISYANDQNWQQELQNSAVEMEQYSCDRWLVVQLANKSPYEVLRIELITPGRYTRAQLARARLHIEERTLEKIANQKPGRNDRCPCGSGKKYKKCHGS